MTDTERTSCGTRRKPEKKTRGQRSPRRQHDAKLTPNTPELDRSMMTYNAALIEEAREFVSKSHVGSVTARELDHAIGLLRKIIDNADRLHPQKPEPVPDNPELTKVLESLGIDRSRVIDALMEVTVRCMWRTEAAWPAGGTYEADLPRNLGDKMVAQKLTTKTTIDIIGNHPAGRELPPTSSDYTRSRIETTEDGEWVNCAR